MPVSRERRLVKPGAGREAKKKPREEASRGFEDRSCGHAANSVKSAAQTESPWGNLSDTKWISRRRSSIQAARHLCLDWLRRVGGHLGGQRAHLFGLRLQGADLVAPIGRLQLHGFGKVLCRRQALRKIEAGIDVALSNVDDLAVERDGALTDRVERPFPTLEHGVERVLGALVDLSCLSNVLLGQSAHCLRHLTVAGKVLELSSGLAICIARLLGGSF